MAMNFKACVIMQRTLSFSTTTPYQKQGITRKKARCWKSGFIIKHFCLMLLCAIQLINLAFNFSREIYYGLHNVTIPIQLAKNTSLVKLRNDGTSRRKMKYPFKNIQRTWKELWSKKLQILWRKVEWIRPVYFNPTSRTFPEN